jgi:hypothetical protein
MTLRLYSEGDGPGRVYKALVTHCRYDPDTEGVPLESPSYDTLANLYLGA